MDAYYGYNQILMHPLDKAKIAFITDDGSYYYKVMPLGLKDAGATYQRLMDRIFKDCIDHDLEVYVDDMVAKLATREQHYEKCSFGVQAGKFLGFMLTRRGIKVNLEKCEVVINMGTR
ncbi:Retrovirus-related Pol polyprotein from transposon 17.6, partial [Mucuna pruriens]